ncbi:prepilin peptidase [Cryobacterium sp. SO2]|uniref:prepilin peptidase n=1 Tax=Cryobacterium sp. SO2 TaxID=1897060 RepID=UPI00223DC5F1|nr:A24 family peptidase [Cryobacterium sp. SO2]WEO76793.1 prepilin peptidase [Cryobacterium sp. SO2]
MTAPILTALVLVGLLGLPVGSYLTVAVHRVPRGDSASTMPGSCPRCGRPIAVTDAVPLLSWLLLRGRCRSCGAPISVRYPLVEAGTAVFFTVVAWWALVGPGRGLSAGGHASVGVGLMLAPYLYLAAVSIVLCLIDLDTHTLPDRVVLPAYLIGGALLAATAIARGEPSRLLAGVLGLVFLWSLYFLLAVLSPGGMGFGDVKLAGLLGLYLGWLGWGPLVVGGLGAFLLGGVFAVVLLATRRVGRTGGIPFGPWMLAGAWTGILAGELLWEAYLGSVSFAAAPGSG